MLKKSCKHGHRFTPKNTYVRRDGGRACRECVRARTRKWRTANFEKYRACERASKRARYAANPEKMRAYNRAWRAAHLEERRAQQRVWQRAWYAANAERKRENGLAYYRRLRRRTLEAYGNKCTHCGRNDSLHLHHVNGGGVAHREEVGSIYLWAIRNNFPPTLEPLCVDCHQAAHRELKKAA